jgi:hypothetical protein
MSPATSTKPAGAGGPASAGPANITDRPDDVVYHELMERWLVQSMEHVAQLLVITTSLCESRTIVLAQDADERAAVLAADVAILVSVPVNGHENVPDSTPALPPLS